MVEHIRPALSPDDWATVLAHGEGVKDMFRDAFRNTKYSGHAIAAMLLLDEPYGFTHFFFIGNHKVTFE